MDQNDLHDLLRSKTKKIEQTSGLGGILAGLWRKILFDLNVEAGRMDHCINQYIEYMRRHPIDPEQGARESRGNLRRALALDTMTIKVFIKALRVLGVRKVRFVVELHHAHGEPTAHGWNVDLMDDKLFADLTRKTNDDE